MKNGRPHKHRQRRDKTPSVICLPPPKPPVSVPRHESEVARALSFPVLEEPLVTRTKRSAQKAGTEKRQLRRKTRRDQVKEQACTPANAKADASETAASEKLAPLPKNKALTLSRPGMLEQLGGWLRKWVVVKRPAAGMPAAGPSQSQINTLRRQIASLQKTLDRMAESSRT